jgi:hypothetical protein
MEHELVGAGPERRSRQQRRIRAPVGIGRGGQDRLAVPAIETEQIDPDTGCRAAIGRIEDMCRETAHDVFQLLTVSGKHRESEGRNRELPQYCPIDFEADANISGGLIPPKRVSWSEL